MSDRSSDEHRRAGPSIKGQPLAAFTFRHYEALEEWFVSASKALKLDCPTENEISALAEIKAARNILEHNAGIVNESYREKAGPKSRYEIGESIELDDDYHLESWRLIKKVVGDMTAAATAPCEIVTPLTLSPPLLLHALLVDPLQQFGLPTPGRLVFT